MEAEATKCITDLGLTFDVNDVTTYNRCFPNDWS